jgi:hypothetical protein
MRWKQWLLAAALPVMLAGCYTGRARVSYAYATYDPPPPRYTYVETRPGYVWVDGHWYWNSYDWAWRPGYYVVDRPGYSYVQGYYHNRVYRPGYWSPRRTVVVDRPHRLEVRHPQRGNSGKVIIRDHRR